MLEIKQEPSDKFDFEQFTSMEPLDVMPGEELPLTFLEYLENQNNPNPEDPTFSGSFTNPGDIFEFLEDPKSEETSDTQNNPMFDSPSSSPPNFQHTPPIESPIQFATQLPKSGLSLRILGVPLKSRVETQLKLCLQLVNPKGAISSSWKYLLFPEHLVVSGKRLKKEDKVKAEPGSCIKVEAGVVCSSNLSRQVLRCFGCIQRERKSIQRKKKNSSGSSTEEPYSIEEEQKKILQFYCNPKVDFSCGEAIVPTRITCYCRHHEEKSGFQIWITLKDSITNEVIAQGLSSQVMITDDHKSKSKSNPIPVPAPKRQRNTTVKQEEESPQILDSPFIEKVIPTEGPLTGGIEVSVLGKQFTANSVVQFGDADAIRTDYWGPTTLLCVLPPSLSAGAVPVTVKGGNLDIQDPVMFTYKDDSERMMMELALQVVGMKLTGKVGDAKQIAMRIVNSNQINFGKGATVNMPQQFDYHKNVEEIVYNSLENVLSISNEHQANLSLKDARGHTLLMYATFAGSHPLTKLLLQYGADPNDQDNCGFSALHFACMNGYQAIVKILVEESRVKINKELKDKLGRTARFLANEGGFKSILEMLDAPSFLETPKLVPEISTPPTLLHSSNLSPSLPNEPRNRTGHQLEIEVEEDMPHPSRFSSFIENLTSRINQLNRMESRGDEESLKPADKQRTFFLFNMVRTIFTSYKILLTIGVVLLLVGMVIAGVAPWNFFAPKSVHNPNNQNQQEIIQNVPEGGVLPPEEKVPSADYWLEVGLLLLLVTVIIGAVAYKFRYTWKVKTVIAILGVVFSVFVFSQLLVFIWE